FFSHLSISEASCMHCLSPKMVCETKIVADEHSIPGTKKDSIIVSASQMWTSSSSSPNSLEENLNKDTVFIREFELTDHEDVRRIFYDGIMERIPNTAFRGLKQQTKMQILYTCITIMCFVLTKSVALTCCVPVLLMGARYYFSRKVILSFLDCALHTDMADIEQYYMKPAGKGFSMGSEELEISSKRLPQHEVDGRAGGRGSCFWVAVLQGKVVGIVAAQGNEEDNTVELRRMSVDLRYRGKGIAKTLGRKVLEFAMLNNYSAIVLGTTAVKLAAHKLYESLGFKHMGVTEEYTLPGMSHSFVERMFFQLRYHRYRLQLREE
ncbi:NAT8L synthetase, partial [Polyodon spathula]|nr:NAT8L synthetase [Polyodon spathula]